MRLRRSRRGRRRAWGAGPRGPRSVALALGPGPGLQSEAWGRGPGRWAMVSSGRSGRAAPARGHAAPPGAGLLGVTQTHPGSQRSPSHKEPRVTTGPRPHPRPPSDPHSRCPPPQAGLGEQRRRAQSLGWRCRAGDCALGVLSWAVGNQGEWGSFPVPRRNPRWPWCLQGHSWGPVPPPREFQVHPGSHASQSPPALCVLLPRCLFVEGGV